MKKLSTLIAFVFAGIIGAVVGNTVIPPKASAASLGVLMWCTSVNSNAAGTNITETCVGAPGDTSGLTNVVLEFTGSTQRYPLDTTSTITLP